MSTISDPELQAAKEQLHRLSTQVMYASENGLFTKPENFKNKIDDAIQRAERALAEKKPLDASICTYEAKRVFDEAWNAAPKIWIAFFERGWMHHLFTFMGAGTAVVVLWAVWQDEFCHIHKCSALFGMLGAFVRCLYWTSFQANQRMLRRVWAAQNFISPLIGLILGCAADFILRSSLVLITQAKTEPNEYASAVIVFYAGFNWEWVLDLLHKVASHIQTKETDSKSSIKKS